MGDAKDARDVKTDDEGLVERELDEGTEELGKSDYCSSARRQMSSDTDNDARVVDEADDERGDGADDAVLLGRESSAALEQRVERIELLWALLEGTDEDAKGRELLKHDAVDETRVLDEAGPGDTDEDDTTELRGVDGLERGGEALETGAQLLLRDADDDATLPERPELVIRELEAELRDADRDDDTELMTRELKAELRDEAADDDTELRDSLTSSEELETGAELLARELDDAELREADVEDDATLLERERARELDTGAELLPRPDWTSRSGRLSGCCGGPECLTLHSAEDNEDTGLLPREALERRTGAELDARVELERDAGAELREVGDEADDADDDTVLLAREKLERAELELDTELLEREVGAELLREAEELKRMDEGVGERGYSSRRRSGLLLECEADEDTLELDGDARYWSRQGTDIDGAELLLEREADETTELLRTLGVEPTKRGCWTMSAGPKTTRPRSCCAHYCSGLTTMRRWSWSATRPTWRSRGRTRLTQWETQATEDVCAGPAARADDGAGI
ncbi:hypothetical protein B0H15DRAFT_799323 [Mycena belliarum]|uniref:Uncharacterized protein n=1 Tax=Mycena belliarum TaxID=1033014 RepID=A0AAD6U9X0_9AGAR|nr:hypothetical protein B0H15DRAFT_799323 [Mycena belliae]